MGSEKKTDADLDEDGSTGNPAGRIQNKKEHNKMEAKQNRTTSTQRQDAKEKRQSKKREEHMNA